MRNLKGFIVGFILASALGTAISAGFDAKDPPAVKTINSRWNFSATAGQAYSLKLTINGVDIVDKSGNVPAGKSISGELLLNAEIQ